MTKIKISIKNRWTGNVIFKYEKENNSIKDALLAAIAAGSDLSDSDLSDSDLRGSNLRGSNLRGSDLSGSDLSGSNLRGSDLSGSNLRGSNLRGSNLRGSNLSGSDLSGSNLRGSDLSDSDLRGSNLRGSNLRGSNLRGSDLRGSDLSGSDLHGSNLSGSDLSGSDLSGSNLRHTKNDMFIVLLHAIPEVPFLKKNIVEGNIDGSTYDGVCACLSGTLANGAKISNGEREKMVVKNIFDCRDSSRPIERFFLGIKKGDTPETSQFSKLALQWIEEFETLLSIR